MEYNFVLIGDFGPVSNSTMTQDRADQLNAEMSKTDDYRYWQWMKL